ncbi:3366_t:CDS:2, partial [Scutellospora calospora]
VDMLDKERQQFDNKDIKTRYIVEDKFSINNIVYLTTNTIAKNIKQY